MLSRLQAAFKPSEMSQRIEELKKQKQQIDSQIPKLSEAMKNMNLEASTRAGLNIKKTEKSKKENEIQKM